MIPQKLASSFRDPCGFLFTYKQVLYRQVNSLYKENYEHLMGSGLYKALVDNYLLLPHDESDIGFSATPEAYKIIKPELIPFISYPYEWSFSQLKDAALLTLQIQKVALKYGMSLKDSTAYNVQFQNAKPIFIDTLSFEKYIEGEPWVAYKQFCQHFFAPLALMNFSDIRLNQLLRIYIDGIPLDLVSKLLPTKTKFSFPFLTHIHLHAKSQKHFSDKTSSKTQRKISRTSFLGLIDNLETAIKKLSWKPGNTEWADYYEDTNYSSNALTNKKEIISGFLNDLSPKYVWDLGANDGFFSRIATEKGIQTISFDIDPAAIEKNYLNCKNNGETKILPLLLDLTNPSSGLGWENKERMSFEQRGPVETAFALALIHHLAISNNLPLERIAKFFNKICNSLIIEWVPKHDSQVQRLLSTREDIFLNYTKNEFEKAFKNYFNIKYFLQIKESERILYLMVKMDN